MGCVNQKQRKSTTKKPTQQAITQPDIIHDQIDVNSGVIKQEVIDRACGYLFQVEGDDNGVGGSVDGNVGGKFVRGYSREEMMEGTVVTPSDQLTQIIQKCKQYYRNHDIDTAHNYLSKIPKFLQTHSQSPHIPQLQHVLDLHKSQLEQIEQEYNDVIMYQNEILKGGWIQKSNRKGVRVSTRRQQTTVGVLVQSIVEEPFQVLISFCIQMDLYKEFMPFMKVSKQEKIVDRNCRIGFTENHIPIVSVREAYFQGIGYNRLHKNNTLFLFTRSIHNRPDLQKKLGYTCHINENYVQLEYKYFVLWYEPICRGKGRITLAMNVDTKLNFIPMWIQDKISQDFGQQFFENIIKLSKKFKGSLWQKNTSSNPQLFQFFKTAIDNRLAQLQKQQKQGISRSVPTNTSYSTTMPTL